MIDGLISVVLSLRYNSFTFQSHKFLNVISLFIRCVLIQSRQNGTDGPINL